MIAKRDTELAKGQPVAASCHDADALRRAEALGCDFAVLGPVAVFFLTGKPSSSNSTTRSCGLE